MCAEQPQYNNVELRQNPTKEQTIMQSVKVERDNRNIKQQIGDIK